ncbi:MAG: patatin-like phospholipase family protein, partial [Sinobacterium sp.]|nr:patatin-like phospholipase family protein [Sinobacterium sp.]
MLILHATFSLIRQVFTCLIACVLLCSSLFPATAYAKPETTRPKIALVLAGGGAKGTAHIGILKMLEEQRIPIDIITGTSIGSVVGGLYALGYDADTIEEKMLSSNFNRGYSDAIPRENLRYRRKQEKDQFNIPLDLGMKEGSVIMPDGALQGQTMNQILREMTGLVAEQDSFDNFAIPFRAIATSLSNRDTVVIDSGSLTVAMRASSSVPGALAPESYKGLLLVDGGISNNIPIQEAKNLGADIVIAVDISSPLKDQDEISGALSVINQLTGFLTNEGTEQQLKYLSPQDIYISPEIEGMSMTDFSIMPEALAAGTAAAQLHIKQLQKLSVSEAEYAAYTLKKQEKLKQLVIQSSERVSALIIDNQSDVHIDYIEHYLSILPGEAINVSEVNGAVDRIYSSAEFQRVDVSIQKNADDNETIIITTEKKSWGPNYLEFGIGWEEDITDESVFNLDIAYTATNLTTYGAQWRSQLEIGHEQAIRTEFYAPLVASRWLYSRTAYEYETEKWNLFYNNTPVADFDKQAHIIHLGLGWNFHQSGFIETGARVEKGKISNTNIMSDLKYNAAAPYVLFGFDTLDSISFPTQGRRFTVSYFSPIENIKEHDELVAPIAHTKSRSQIFDISWKGA